ncbi:Ig-like domain-containing protein [Thermithiobacillus plumbiphilus]|uniref:Ig-like domain-containing protein n=1 Tax=Thermithiobacillus plumbiphilus TaxID=1729899 RepID=A0ABU9DBR7_9PROT
MQRFERITQPVLGLTALLAVALMAGCGSDQEPILGTPATVRGPTVTAIVPQANTSGVPVNTKTITAAFSKAMDPATINASSMTLACAVGTPMSGVVSYQPVGNMATLTLPANTNLPASTTCTATVTSEAKDTYGTALGSNYVWTFTTGATADTTPPVVNFTIPETTIPGPTASVPTNTAIQAVFSEDMAPTSITPDSLTLTCAAPCVSPAGNVGYSAASRTAVFKPGAALAPNTTYTATVTTAATDLAANALSGNQGTYPAPSIYIWTFTTAATPDTTPPTVTLVNPADASTGVCLNKAVNATFSEAMDPLTITNGSFTLQSAGSGPLGGTVSYNASTRIATFTASNTLLANTSYTATVTNGVKDVAGNPLASNKTWSFTTGAQACSLVSPVALGAAAPFGNLGGTKGTTNQGINTLVGGDLGSTAVAPSAITGFHDSAGDIYTEDGSNRGAVAGKIYTCTTSSTGPTSAAVNPASCTTATNALADAQKAYDKLSPASLPGGIDPKAGQLGGLTLAPGVYQAADGSFQITGSDLTLDGQGDANAVWVFQTASTLTVGAPAAPRSIILINGAQAKNVFWRVGSSATINGAGGGTMIGTILASEAVSISTAGNVAQVTLNGRAIGLNASVTMVNTTINVPAP